MQGRAGKPGRSFIRVTGLVRLTFNHVVGQFVDLLADLTWKLLGQDPAQVSDGIDQGVGEMLLAEVCPHLFHHPAPKIVAAFLMDSGVAHDREFLGARRDKNEDCIAMLGPVHLEFEELLLRERQCFATDLATLKIDADVP